MNLGRILPQTKFDRFAMEKFEDIVDHDHCSYVHNLSSCEMIVIVQIYDTHIFICILPCKK